VDESLVANADRAVEVSAICSIPLVSTRADALAFEDHAVPAIIDRIADDIAVVLIAEDEREFSCSATALPPGVREGGAVRLLLEGDQIFYIEADPDEDAVRAARIGAQLEWLRRNRTP
jgi:hypothetical protein